MVTRLFIQYLETFSASELKKFQQVVLPELKKETDKKAFSYILESKLQHVVIDETKLSSLLGANDDNESRLFKKFFSKCSQLTEEYLISQELRKDEYKLLRSTLLLRRLKHYKEEVLFDHNLKKTAKLAQKVEPSDVLNLLSRVLLIHEVFYHPMFDKAKLPKGHDFYSYSQQINKLEMAFLLGKYKFAVTEIVRSRLEKTQKEVLDLEGLLKEDLRFSKKEFPLLHVYRLSISIFKDFDEQSYLHLKESIKDLVVNRKIRQEEQEVIFRILVNHTAQAIRFDKKYLEDGYKNYRFGITHNLLLQSGYLPSEHFFNYVTLSCSFGRTKAANRFVYDYKNQLLVSKRSQVVQIAEALILLAENDYEKAYLSLNDKNFKDPHLRLMARSNRLIACYDRENSASSIFTLDGEWVSVASELDSFKRVILRLKSALGKKNERIIANENLIKMIRTMEKARNEVVRPKQKLLAQLQGYKVIACRKWLEQKIEEL